MVYNVKENNIFQFDRDNRKIYHRISPLYTIVKCALYIYLKITKKKISKI